MIVSLDEQLEHEVRNAEFIAALKTGIARFGDYRAAMPFVEKSYTRTLLNRTMEYELVAMHWAPGAVSPIHDHGDSRCWVVILEGALDVDNYDRLDDFSNDVAQIRHTSANHLTTGQLDHRYNRRELHKVRNTGATCTYSLQLYASPITGYTTFEEGTGRIGHLEANYDSIFDLKA
jgi:predicted metal-dependent enzyme (double-stranded beta helix superfamily)